LGISEHVLEQNNSRNYAWRQIEKAKASVNEFITDKNGHPYRDSQDNVRVGLAKLGVEVTYNSFSDVMVVSGMEELGRGLDDAAIDRIWLQLDARFRFRPSKEFLRTVICDDARRSSFHPVCDYLDALTWDGVERIDSWLMKHAGASDTPFVRAVGALML